MEENAKVEYVQVRTPDKSRVGQYVVRAKGPNRTMAAFSEECGINPSTLSRVVNGKLKGSLSAEQIISIYEHRDAESEISLEGFMSANGMMSEQEKRNRDAHYMHSEVREFQIEAETKSKNIIGDELDRRDIPSIMYGRIPPCHSMNAKSKFKLRRPSTFAARVSDGDGEFLWNFILFPYQKDTSDERMRRMMIPRFQERYAGMFLMDAWEPELFDGMRNSIVFIDIDYFNEYSEMLMQARVNTYISLILVNLEKGIVEKELQLPTNNGNKQDSIFDREIVNPDYDEFDDWHDEPFGNDDDNDDEE